jgi:hypothetical protein
MYGMTLSDTYWYGELKYWLVSVGFTICPTPALLCSPVKKKMAHPSDSLSTLMICLYFYTYDSARENSKNQLVDRFNGELQGLAYWYLTARISQDKEFNATLNQSR